MLRIQDRPGPTRQLEDWGLPVILGLASFAVYWRTCAPDITWAHHGADGGDLLAAVRVLGIPHPPGYPLYVLAARLFALLPVGNFAFRLNLFSACCAALAVVCLYLWLRATLGALAVHDSHLAAWASAAASLLLAFSPLFWSQALITEVYALNALCVALCLLLLSRWQTAQRRGGSGYGALALLALLFGLGLGNHPTLLLLLPVLLWSTSPSPLRGRANLMAAVPAFLIGLSIYLYLPLRASAGPLINWGDPRTWERFWWTSLRQAISCLYLCHPIHRMVAARASLGQPLGAPIQPDGMAPGHDRPGGALARLASALLHYPRRVPALQPLRRGL